MQKILSSCFILVTLLVPMQGHSQWIQTNGPSGHVNVQSFAYTQLITVISTPCGIHNSTDQGNSWHKKLNESFTSFVLKNDSLFYSPDDYGISLIKIDAPGYEPVSCGMSGYHVYDICSEGSTLYAGAEYGGFYYASVGQYNWIQNNTGLPGDTIWTPFGIIVRWNVYAIGIQGNYVFASTNKGMFKSPIGQLNWSPSSTGLPAEPATFITSINEELFTGINNVLFRSANQGGIWSSFYSADSTVTSLIKKNGLYYISSLNEGIVCSADGQDWVPLNSGFTDLNVNFISTAADILVAGTQSDGLFYFTDDLWQPRNASILCTYIRSLAASNNHLAVCDLYDAYLSGDGGNSWNLITPEIDRQHLGDLLLNGDTVFLSYHSVTSQRIIYSPDLGNEWTELNPPPFEGDDSYGLYFDGVKLYASENDKMYYTNDLGITWHDISLPPEYCNNFFAFTKFNSTCFASTCGNAEVLRLNDMDQWILTNNGLPSYEVNYLGNSENALFAFLTYYGMFISTDNGHSWSPTNSGYLGGYGRGSCYLGSNLFLTTDYGAYLTPDNGSTWMAINDGLPDNTGLLGIIMMNDTLYVGTSLNAVWKRPINELPVEIEEINPKNGLSIFPNPSDGKFNVNYASKGEPTMIRVYDMTGRRIYNEHFLTNQVRIKLDQVDNGVYIVNLDSGCKIFVKKLIIAR